VPAPEYVGKSGATDLVRKDPKYGDWLYQGDAMLPVSGAVPWTTPALSNEVQI